MIQLTRLNGKAFILNSLFIRTLEATPDTVITLMSGEKMMVLENIEEIIQKHIKFQKNCVQGQWTQYDSPLHASMEKNPFLFK